MYSKLQYISQGETAAVQLNNIREALDAGCKWVQLRFKNATADEVTDLAIRIKKLCTDHAATFIVNDQPHIAKVVDADGVHLGKTDVAINYAREILGPGKIIGGTANTLDDVLKHADRGFCYVGLGPYSFTLTKAKLSPILGINGYNEIMNALRQRHISIPVYAIGGIKLEDTQPIMNTGIYGVAVSGAITTHSDKKTLIEQFNSIINETTNNSR